MSPDTPEMLDLVDRDDNVIGEVSKELANSDSRYTHREVGVVLYRENDLLLQQRALTKQVEPGKWTIAAVGHVTKGYSPLEAAHKELQEELGFDTELQFFQKIWNEIRTETRWFYHYVGKYNGQHIRPQGEEVAAVKIFTEKECLELIKANQVTTTSAKLIADFYTNRIPRPF